MDGRMVDLLALALACGLVLGGSLLIAAGLVLHGLKDE